MNTIEIILSEIFKMVSYEEICYFLILVSGANLIALFASMRTKFEGLFFSTMLIFLALIIYFFLKSMG